MSAFFNTTINIHCEQESVITINDCFSFLYKCTQIVEQLTNMEQIWYLTGHSRKEASKYIVFDNAKPNDNVRAIFENHYKKNHPLINESIWNCKPDGLACSVTHYMKSISNPKKSNIIIDIDQKVTTYVDMIHSLTSLSKLKNKAWIKVDSKGYWLHDRNVFPDRMYVGWMLYIPHIVLPELIPEAANVIPVMDEGKQKGTIVVSTEDIFDGENKEHIGKANDIEIRLVELGFLPLMTEL